MEGTNMQCPKCQFENPQDSNFCLECGQKLEQKCPQCEKALPVGAKFCNGCGHKLTATPAPPLKELSFDEKLNKIQRYLPEGLTERILSQKDRIEGERKHVTVMFCDLVGFTALSERLGPEKAYAIMDEVYEILIHKVHDYEGTVNEMTGDGIMALFGAPIALEDAPQRAIHSSYAIHIEMAKFSDRPKQEKEMTSPLKMRIGVHTGPVVVGSLGNDLRVEFKAVGDTVNLASRMENMAQPGTTYVTEETFKLTEGFFQFEALGKRKVKGKQESVETYQVIGPSTRRTRFDVSADRGLTPLNGRERELEILLDSFEHAKAGRGQAVSIVGEAGVGKSRLLYEFRKAVSSEDALFLEGRCLSYSRGVAFYPIIDILKANFDIRESDRDPEIKEKIKKGINIVKADEESTLPYLLELFSVTESGIDKFSLSPEGKKDRIIQAVKRITFKGSEIRPLILAYEDLHWMDNGSEDVLKNVLGSIPGARILMIFTFRPEFVHTWGGKSYHSQLTLNRLSNRESLAMATHLLGTEKIDRDLADLILGRTEGIPFFIEEFAKSLKALNIITRKDNKYYLTEKFSAKDVQEVMIPSTIQDVIMARVDSLSESSKEILLIGSVMGREFNYTLIKTLTSLPEQELLSHISVLKDAELLYERGIYPETTFIFKHALTQEVVYDSILTKRKKNLHAQIGNAIEENFRDNLHEHYTILSEHYVTGDNYEKGAEYSKLAGKRNEKTASINEAIDYAKKQIFCLEKLPVTEDIQKKIIDARTALGLYIVQLNYPIAAKEAVAPIIDLSQKIGYKRRLPQIYVITGQYEFEVQEDFPKALNHFEEALKISQGENDILSLFFANYSLGLALLLSCEFEKANDHLGKALEINVAANSLWGISTMKIFLSWVNLNNGKIHIGCQLSVEGLRLAEESGDIYSKSIAHINHGYALICKGSLIEAEEYLLKGNELCDKINFFIWNAFAQTHLAETYFQIREYEKSKVHYGKAITYLKQAGFGHSRANFGRLGIARAKVMSNEKDIDLESLYGYVEQNNLKEFDGQMPRYVAEILLNIDDQHLTEAEDWAEKAIESDKQNGMEFRLGQDYVLYAEVFKRKGDQSKAKGNLNQAIETFKKCGADGWVEKYAKELASLS
jgi:class 3 adenylate cyclase/tetratricopeptide (TPR) repeat protein